MKKNQHSLGERMYKAAFLPLGNAQPPGHKGSKSSQQSVFYQMGKLAPAALCGRRIFEMKGSFFHFVG